MCVTAFGAGDRWNAARPSSTVPVMDLYIASCKDLPEPDLDAEPLKQALLSAGIYSRVLGWDDPAAPWSEAPAILLRSTWNYPQYPSAFMDWLTEVTDLAPMWNPADVVRWNVHKGYLCELSEAGLPVTPTVLVQRGNTRSLCSIMDEQGWGRAVVKPAISAASFRTLRVDDPRSVAGEAHLRALASDADVLVQAYLDSVEEYGERALVWIDGELTHSVRKTPRWDGEDECVSAAVPISASEAELAERTLAAVSSPLLYARIDVAPGPSGDPLLMELELIEPSLFFPQHPPALRRYVEGIRRRL